MSFRSLLSANGFLIVPFLCLGANMGTAHAAVKAPVETFLEEALPVTPLPAERFKNEPIPAGTLSLEDVLKAYKRPAPKKSSLPNASGFLMHQGMKAVLQKHELPATPPALAPNAEAQKPDAAPLSLLSDTKAEPKAKNAADAAPAVSKENGISFVPGREPKNLNDFVPAQPAPSPVPTEVKAGPLVETPCFKSITKWKKTCVEAGYPSSFIGEIIGETRETCEDGSLHDFWVANSCSPPQAQPVAASASEEEKPVATTPTQTEPLPEEKQPQEKSLTAVKKDKDNEAATASLPEEKQPEETKEEAVKASTPEAAPTEDRAVPLPTKTEQPDAKPASDTKAEPSPLSVKVDTSLCGIASETLAYEAPEKNLCREGRAGPVEGQGPWIWSCTNNEGKTSSCETLSLKREDPAPKKDAKAVQEKTKAEKTKHVAPTSTDAKKAAPPIKKAPLPTKSDIPSSEKVFSPAPTPTPIPKAANITADKAPAKAPPLPDDAAPVPPPGVRDSLPPTPVLQENKTLQETPKTSSDLLDIPEALSSLSFAAEEKDLDDKAKAALDLLAELLRKNEGARIALFAYTAKKDTPERVAHKRALDRALAVRTYLSGHGISESRMDIHAEGFSPDHGERVDIKAQ
ncbi:MAG: OmpA family protein [Alphaproteobacteria bacterium]|nr:OmpA family protein [Alphaproteobacteria bacterium]